MVKTRSAPHIRVCSRNQREKSVNDGEKNGGVEREGGEGLRQMRCPADYSYHMHSQWLSDSHRRQCNKWQQSLGTTPPPRRRGTDGNSTFNELKPNQEYGPMNGRLSSRPTPLALRARFVRMEIASPEGCAALKARALTQLHTMYMLWRELGWGIQSQLGQPCC